MSISSVTSLSSNLYTSASAGNTSSSKDSIGANLTTFDWDYLKMRYGKSSIEEVVADPHATAEIQNLERAAESNSVPGNPRAFDPTEYLTASDAAMLESMTGTTTLDDALAHDENTRSMADLIGIERESGDLTGDISTSFLQTYISANVGWAPASTFQKALSYVEQKAQDGKSGAKINQMA